MTEISEAAKAKAVELFKAEDALDPRPTAIQWTNAFARFTQEVSDAAKEVAGQFPGTNVSSLLAPFILPDPVDTLLFEAREIVLSESIARTENQVQAIRDGRAGQDKIALALTALKRGIELGRQS